jgi:hypothetical protein
MKLNEEKSGNQFIIRVVMIYTQNVSRARLGGNKKEEKYM